jgi:hypothetical protein
MGEDFQPYPVWLQISSPQIIVSSFVSAFRLTANKKGTPPLGVPTSTKLPRTLMNLLHPSCNLTLYHVRWTAVNQSHTLTGTLKVRSHDANRAAIQARISVWRQRLAGPCPFTEISAVVLSPVTEGKR